MGGLGGPPRQAIYAPIGLNISRFCAPSTSPRFRPSVFSILPRAAAAATPSRPPDETAVALSRDAPFDCDCVPRVFVCHGAKLRDTSRRAVIYRRRRSPPSKWARCARFTGLEGTLTADNAWPPSADSLRVAIAGKSADPTLHNRLKNSVTRGE